MDVSAEVLCIKLGWKCLWCSCFKRVWLAGALSFLTLHQDHFWPAQLSRPWQSHLCSRFLGPPHIPLTGSPASRSPSTPREVGTWLRCCLAPELLPLVTDCLVTGQPKPFFSLPIFLAVVLPWGVLYTFNGKFCSSTPCYISTWEFNFFHLVIYKYLFSCRTGIQVRMSDQTFHLLTPALSSG